MSGSLAKFVSGSILRHIVVMSASSGLGLLAIFLVDFADLWFISLLGEDALAAAIGYAGTVLFFVTSIGVGFSIAMGALTARALGGEDAERSRRIAANVVGLVMVAGIAIAILLFAFAPVLSGALGATGKALDYSVSYLRIAAFGTPFLLLGMSGMALLRSHGDARRAMTATISAALANAILDPLLIFGVGWGVEGAALATVISRIVLAQATWRPVIAVYHGVEWPSLASCLAGSAPIFSIAGPAIMTNVATPVGNAFVTRMIAEFGTQAVAGYAVIGRLMPMAFCLIFALSGAVGPIIGQNFGAGNHARVRQTIVTSLLVTLVYTLAVSLALFLLRAPIVDLFSARGEAIALIYLFCGPLALAFFFNGALFVSNAAFNNLNRPLRSTALNWGRHTIGTIPFAWAGAAWFGAGGVLIGQSAGGAIFAAIAVWLSLQVAGGKGGGPPGDRPPAGLLRRLPQSPFSSLRP